MIYKPELPPIKRTCISYNPAPEQETVDEYPGWDNWKRRVILHRFFAGFFILVSTCIASKLMYSVLAGPRVTALEWVLWSVFVLLFFWLATNFWISFIGFMILILRRSHFNPSSRIKDKKIALPEHGTAIVMPIYNEDPRKVFARIKSMYLSLREQNSDADKYFHFFILSDTVKPERWSEEEYCWQKLCAELGNCNSIFYRRRKIRLHKKHGNVMDFCRRWGSLYKYMVVLDSDSLMTGKMFYKMAKIMEVSPDIGILQSITRGIHQQTPLARAEQFANHLYGPLFIAGLHFLQMGDAAFWGHNAIIRLEPYMKYCALPHLPGRPPFGGEILSHDFVEAAFMRRAGYGVWMAPDLQDSYEESPQNLLEEIVRDRRWSTGNAQHVRFVFMPGLTFGHRMLLIYGNLYYWSSALWFLLLVLSTVIGIRDTVWSHDYFSSPQRLLFPVWPVEHRELSIKLLIVTLIFLLGGKFLALILGLFSKRITLCFGGVPRLLCSICLETVLTVFLAPVKMMFHTWFLFKGLIFGQTESWNVNRDNGDTRFLDACRALWQVSAAGLLWSVVTYLFSPVVFCWMISILIPLIVAVPFTVWSGGSGHGEILKKSRLFLTPPEFHVPRESKWFNEFSGSGMDRSPSQCDYFTEKGRVN